jgi:hypothetical protein
MRTRTFGPLLLVSAACSSAPQVSVYRLGVGDQSQSLQGDPVKLKAAPDEPMPGIQRGYHVVRGEEDWQAAFGDTKAPPLPAGTASSKTMLLVGVPESQDATDVTITKVVESTGYLHVWARETMRGDGCARSKEIPHAAVLVPRIEKAAKFYVEEARAESCGEPPKAELSCRKNDEKSWATSTSIAAEPGDLVECELKAESRGRFALVDRVLSLTRVPAGSTAKLAFAHGPLRSALRIDRFGTYSIRGEATDEKNRKGFADLEVRAQAPRSKDAHVLLVWSDLDPNSDPDTLPRLTLVAQPSGHECSLDKQPADICQMKRFGANTVLALKASQGKVPLEVRYVDERADKGPTACVEVWFDGARTAQACDRAARPTDAHWSPGAVDMTTGELTAIPSPVAVADAGAPAAPPKKPSAPGKPK